LTSESLLLTPLPIPWRTKIATTAISAKISAYSTKLWPFRPFSPRYIFRRDFRIFLFTSFITLQSFDPCHPQTYVHSGARKGSLRATWRLEPPPDKSPRPLGNHNSLSPKSLRGEMNSRGYLHVASPFSHMIVTPAQSCGHVAVVCSASEHLPLPTNFRLSRAGKCNAGLSNQSLSWYQS